MAEDPNTFALFLRMGLSFGLVLGLVAAVTWVLRRRGLLRPVGGAGTGARLEVLDRKSLGKNQSLVLARVGGTAVLLGVSGERIELLSDAEGLDAAWRAEAGAEHGTDALTGAEPGIAAATATTGPVTAGIGSGAPALAALRQRRPAPAGTGAPRATRNPLGARSGAQHTTRTAAHARRTTTTGGARRTGRPVAAPAADRTRMSFVEALQELTVRRS